MAEDRKRARRGDGGGVRLLRSGKYQVRFVGPDKARYTARTPDNKPLTFDTKRAAQAYLTTQRRAMQAGTWIDPGRKDDLPGAITFGEYAAGWLAERELEVRTRELYDQLLRTRLLPTFADTPLVDITPVSVRAWYTRQGTANPTARAHAYGLLRTVLGTAVADDLIPAHPCRVRGGGQTKRAREIRPASLAELEALVNAMPERYRLMTLLGAWCALRFGEVTELRRSDIDTKTGRLRVTRAVAVTKAEGRLVKAPKSEAGVRTVAIPPHLMPLVKDHLAASVHGRDGLLFPSATNPTKHMAASSLHKVFRVAREAAGRPDLAFHDLRHTGAVLAVTRRVASDATAGGIRRIA